MNLNVAILITATTITDATATTLATAIRIIRIIIERI
jgi:hypothetical protein